MSLMVFRLDLHVISGQVLKNHFSVPVPVLIEVPALAEFVGDENGTV
jgi:hypothetical protein